MTRPTTRRATHALAESPLLESLRTLDVFARLDSLLLGDAA